MGACFRFLIRISPLPSLPKMSRRQFLLLRSPPLQSRPCRFDAGLQQGDGGGASAGGVRVLRAPPRQPLPLVFHARYHYHKHAQIQADEHWGEVPVHRIRPHTPREEPCHPGCRSDPVPQPRIHADDPLDAQAGPPCQPDSGHARYHHLPLLLARQLAKEYKLVGLDVKNQGGTINWLTNLDGRSLLAFNWSWQTMAGASGCSL